MTTGDRLRTPRPLLPHRVPSGRRAMEQPNATGDTLTLAFWTAVVATGVATGLLGIAMMLVLHGVQHLAFGYQAGTFGAAVERASGLRRIVALLCGGAVVGPAWFLLRRRRAKGHSDVDDAVWAGTSEIPLVRSAATGTLSEIAVGAGGSLGREAAPKLLGAAAASTLAQWFRLDAEQRRLLVACGGGAGMGAIYNVPIGGALMSAEVLYGQLVLPVILPALVCSTIATLVSWVYLPTAATYAGVATFTVHASQVVFALVAGPLIGVVAVGLVRMVGWVSHHQLRGRRVIAGPLLAFAVLGLLALHYPLLPGNGKDLTREAFLGAATASLMTLLAISVLKPLVTLLCLGSGASGGLFTPVLATGAVLGLLLGQLWSDVWPGAALASYAVVVAAAMVAAATQAPLSALVLVLELTRTTESIVVPMVIATALATLAARYLDGYSIYSARLPARPPEQEAINA